ncbi:hypothetical protein BDY21DRAFT_350484 [Lineolata rhizophorae]|uniref:Nucleic acid-binding protein n=1 Tax=Lineolata rhizophorae TaxID=578093 RepID=A0A6A6NUB9_9PEZI|nr:hypothetical protein BDY21DRAFT_350484 [Lineolata rhizophorae]
MALLSRLFVPHRSITGVVVSTGKMMKTVKVRVATRTWNSHIRKFYPSSVNYLVSDPNNSTREGDVVAIRSGWRTAKHVRHIVTSIIAPFGTPVADRPPLPSLVELEERREEKYEEKKARKKVRVREENAARRAERRKSEIRK